MTCCNRKMGTFEDTKKIGMEETIRGQFGTSRLPVERGRYLLIGALPCPFVQRSRIVLRLLGLDSLIQESLAYPMKTDKGWDFRDSPEGVEPHLGIHYLSEIYDRSVPSYTGRASVPTVVDLKTETVVSNDEDGLTLQWETAWRPLWKPGAPDLYPEDLRNDIDALNQEMLTTLLMGVYTTGLSPSQEEYEKNFDMVFGELDRLEKRLEGQRFLFGDRLTDSDIRLFATLVRFDCAYYMFFLCNRNRLVDFPNLWDYAKCLYSIPAFRETTDFETIKCGYRRVTENVPGMLVPKGPDQSRWNEPCRRTVSHLA